MQSASPSPAATQPNPQTRSVVSGIGIALFVLYLVTYAIRLPGENDFYTEAWPAYRLLIHGHVLRFLQVSPAYVGSLIMRAPLALLGGVFGASPRTTYVLTALPCLLAPGLLAGYVAKYRMGGAHKTASERMRHGLRPIDLFMVTPSAAIAVYGGHPEDILGAVLCLFAVLEARRGHGVLAGFALGAAVIDKSWAVVVVPFVFAVMPAERRLAGFATFAVTAGLVLIPVTLIRAHTVHAGSALGDQTIGIFLVPQLLWWFSRHSWIVREAHVLLVVVDWLVTGAWWWMRVHRRSRPPRLSEVLLALALLFFLRAALDPWDNIYYFVPFILTVMVYEDPPGFPRLSWLYTILLVVVVPPHGLLRGLGLNGHAAAFAVFALPTIAWFGWRAFSGPKSQPAPADSYTTTTESGSAA